MTGGIGTSQWMAPEVLVSQAYDEKADVYSYGIILWEMLTGDVPYRGMREIQVAMSVINHNNRPKIPNNCPQNLAKFIRICWQTDPQKRPEFRTIVRGLESGAISFPGTDISKLTAYAQNCSRLMSSSDLSLVEIPREVDLGAVTPGNVEKIVSELETDEMAIVKLAAVAHRPDMLRPLAQSNIIPVLVKQLTNCQASNLIVHLSLLLSQLLKNETLLASFVKNGGPAVLLDLLPRFCTLMIPSILDCLIAIARRDRLMMTSSHLSRISPFLLYTDLSVRQTAIRLLNLLVESQSFEDVTIFSVVLENLLRNAVLESKQSILVSALGLLTKMSEYLPIKHNLKSLDAPDRVCQLLDHQDCGILTATLRFLQIMVAGAAAKPRTISSFLSRFSSILKRGEPQSALEAVNTLTILMDSSTVYKEFSPSFVEAFSRGLECRSSDVQISILRLCYVFCSNPMTSQAMLPMCPLFITVLRSQFLEAAILAAFSVTALLSLSSGPILGQFAEDLLDFLDSALSAETRLTHAAVRLAGVMAGCLEGVELLEQCNQTAKISSLLSSKSPDLSHLAMMALSAISAASPDSKVMQAILPDLFGFAKASVHGPYPLICISNLSVDADCAIASSPWLPILIEQMASSDKSNAERAIITFYRIMLTREGIQALSDRAVRNQIFDVIDDLWQTEHCPLVIDVLEVLTSSSEVCRWMTSRGMLDNIKKKLVECQINDPNRPKFIRIRSRLMA
jgi:hypothetical protein